MSIYARSGRLGLLTANGRSTGASRAHANEPRRLELITRLQTVLPRTCECSDTECQEPCLCR